jgi:hypothetical protein
VGEVDLKLGSGENFCPLQTRTDEEEERWDLLLVIICQKNLSPWCHRVRQPFPPWDGLVWDLSFCFVAGSAGKNFLDNSTWVFLAVAPPCGWSMSPGSRLLAEDGVSIQHVCKKRLDVRLQVLFWSLLLRLWDYLHILKKKKRRRKN